MKIRIFLALLFAAGLIILTSCDSRDSKTRSSMESLTLGTLSGDFSSLVWIAEERGYFAEHGLKVDIRLYESGMAATKDLLAGKVDLALASEFVAAHNILEGRDLRIITSLCEPDNTKLVARKDRGITQISDIRHKRIGVLRGSGGDFFLDLLVVLQNIPFQEIQKVDLSPSEQVEALLKGEIDAAVIWEPFVSDVSNNLGTNALIWSAQSGQNYYWLLLGTPDGVVRRSRAIKGFVSSLVSAELFVKHHKHEARTIVARKLGVSDPDSLWKGTLFEVSLDPALLLTMEAQMRWIKPGLATKESEIPDLLDFIYFDALKSVQPDRIKMLY